MQLPDALTEAGRPVTDTDVPDTANGVLRFPAGIPGFPDERRFKLHELVEDSGFQLLTSLDDDSVSMVVTVPWLFFPDYAPVLDDSDQQELGLERAEEAVVFCPVSIDAEARRLYVNLRGPFVVNARTNHGRQVVLGDDLPLRAIIELERS